MRREHAGVDHGKIYLSEHLMSACARLGILVQPVRVYQATDKAALERFFRTLPGVPGLALSPLEMFAHGAARAGFLQVPARADLVFDFLKVECRTIQLTWEPPSGWITGVPWPGPDPDSITTSDLHPLIRARLPASTIAAQLATTADHVLLAAARNPASRLPGDPLTARSP